MNAPDGVLDTMHDCAIRLRTKGCTEFAADLDEALSAVAKLIEAAHKAYGHIASVGHPADASGRYHKDGEWTFAEAIPRESDADEIKAAFLVLSAALALARVTPEPKP